MICARAHPTHFFFSYFACKMNKSVAALLCAKYDNRAAMIAHLRSSPLTSGALIQALFFIRTTPSLRLSFRALAQFVELSFVYDLWDVSTTRAHLLNATRVVASFCPSTDLVSLMLARVGGSAAYDFLWRFKPRCLSYCARLDSRVFLALVRPRCGEPRLPFHSAFASLLVKRALCVWPTHTFDAVVRHVSVDAFESVVSSTAIDVGFLIKLHTFFDSLPRCGKTVGGFFRAFLCVFGAHRCRARVLADATGAFLFTRLLTSFRDRWSNDPSSYWEMTAAYLKRSHISNSYIDLVSRVFVADPS